MPSLWDGRRVRFGSPLAPPQTQAAGRALALDPGPSEEGSKCVLIAYIKSELFGILRRQCCCPRK